MAGAKSQAQLLDVVGRNVDGEWLSTIRDVGPGYELIRSEARMMERASLAVSHADDCAFITSAPPGAYSTALVRFRRQNHLAGAVVIKAGSIVSTPRNRRFLLQVDVDLGSTDLVTSFVPVRAEFQGYEWDVLGAQTATDGTPIPGEISVPTLLLLDPPLGDLTIQVEQVDAAIGGAPNTLELHGRDRGLPRLRGERAEEYRERIRSIPLAVTEPNILAAVTAIVARIGIVPTVVETFEPLFGAFDWDGVNPPFVPDADLNGDLPYGHVTDCVHHFGTMFVILPPIQPIEDVGLLLDDPMVGVGDLASPVSGGHRCVNAYDMDNSMLDDDVLPCAADGTDEPRGALEDGLVALLDKIKQGGNIALLFLQGGPP